MRRKSRVDSNQSTIVKALRKLGASVLHLHTLGSGVPDVLVGFRGHNYLLELKDNAKPPSKRRLNPLQEDWHSEWRGSVSRVETIQQALEVLLDREGS